MPVTAFQRQGYGLIRIQILPKDSPSLSATRAEGNGGFRGRIWKALSSRLLATKQNSKPIFKNHLLSQENIVSIIGNQDINFNEWRWRYFKIDRFVDLMDTGTLFFAFARQFEDRLEGAVAILPPGLPIDPRYADPERGERAFEELRRITK